MTAPVSRPDARPPGAVDSAVNADVNVDGAIAAEVDARGMNCPMPILKAKKALSALTSGQLLKVLATDPGSVRDFTAFARQTGNTLVKVDERSTEVAHPRHGTRQWAFYLQRR